MGEQELVVVASYDSQGRRLCPCGKRVGCYRDGNSMYCIPCRRVRQITASARRRYSQLTITRPQVEQLIADSNMRCENCNVQLRWGCQGRVASKKRLLTLQHLYTGRLAIWCHSCNCRDGSLKYWYGRRKSVAA